MTSLGRLGHVFKEDIWRQCLQLQQMIAVQQSDACVSAGVAHSAVTEMMTETAAFAYGVDHRSLHEQIARAAVRSQYSTIC